mmetsp:Transcript_15221/g.30825  ORF Transcript_15221/g.30825 Transcript_15221/m.30825 type:complete len:621 (-) Transcript_15221:208-2070(-)
MLHTYTEYEHQRPASKKQPWYTVPNATNYHAHRKKELLEFQKANSRDTLSAKPPWCGTNRMTSLFRGSEFHIHNTKYLGGYQGQATKCAGIFTKVEGTAKPQSRNEDGFTNQDVVRTRQCREETSRPSTAPSLQSFPGSKHSGSNTGSRRDLREETPDLFIRPQIRVSTSLKRGTGSSHWDSNLSSPSRTVGKHKKRFAKDNVDWKKDTLFYRHNQFPVNLWDDVHHTPVTGIFRHHAKSLEIIEQRLRESQLQKESETEARRVDLQQRRQVALQKLKDLQVARAVLEEMSGQLRNTQPYYSGPLNRPVTAVPAGPRDLDATRSDGFRGFARVKSGELAQLGLSADHAYSETAMELQDESTPIIAKPYDRLAILEPRPDHLSELALSSKIPKHKQKTWRTYKHNPKQNDWDNYNSIAKKHLIQAVHPERDEWAIKKIQQRQMKDFEDEESFIENRRRIHDDIRAKFFEKQCDNFAKEIKSNPLARSRPPSARFMKGRSYTTSVHTNQLAQPKERREQTRAVPLYHNDIQGLVYRHGELQQMERPEYIEERDRELLELSKMANRVRTRTIPKANQVRVNRHAIPRPRKVPPRDAEEAMMMNAEIAAFERRAARMASEARDY